MLKIAFYYYIITQLWDIVLVIPDSLIKICKNGINKIDRNLKLFG